MNWPSGKVRDTFLQYFIRHSKYPHKHVPSSSIVPRNDPSLAFVNAGMNQFKDVIMGLGRPPHPRVTNSQKCLRINDLSLVGTDTYHHTFFEMLGNWSFANYFKAESCEMAWDLLTNVYKLDPKRMYVTYYAGGNNIPMDKETRDIWRSIGIPTDRILPFGSENFWMMGSMGPCGPSTEIHYDHRGTKTESSLVNQDCGNVVEVWNLVFMQYNRSAKGELERLPLSHVVDTGAGLERLTAVLNGQSSNYDTDLFLPIINTIHDESKVPKYEGKFSSDGELDKQYRIFADHIRAVTIALADGILPQNNHKIRKLIRRLLIATQQYFLPSCKSSQDIKQFLLKSISSVSSSLSPTYPEIEIMTNQISEILQEEIVKYLDLKKTGISENDDVLPRTLVTDFPSLGRIKKEEIGRVKSIKYIDGKTAFKWYDSHGVTEEALDELSSTLGIKFNRDEMQNEMSEIKTVFRNERAKSLLLDSEINFIRKLEKILSEYNPKDSGGICRPGLLDCSKDNLSVKWMFSPNGEPLDQNSNKSDFWVILNKTPFIPGNEMMDSDTGLIVLENGSTLIVNKVKALPSGWILHHILSTCSEAHRLLDSKVLEFKIDNAKRFGRQVTVKAFYSLKRWLDRKYRVVRYDKVFLTDNNLLLELTILKGDLGKYIIEEIERDLNEYGDSIIVTKQISKGNGTFEIEFATGIAAEVAKRHGCEISECISKLQTLIKTSKDYDLNKIMNLREVINSVLNNNTLKFPLEVVSQAKEILKEVDKLIFKQEESLQIKLMSESLAEENGPFIIKIFPTDLEFTSLKKITKMVENKPVLILVYSLDGNVQGRASIPQEYLRNGISAQVWLQTVAEELGTGTVNPPKGQDPHLAVNLKRVHVNYLDEKMKRGISRALIYATNIIQEKSKSSNSV